MQMAQLATSINAQNEDEHLFTKKSSFAVANEVGIEFVSFTWQA